MRVVSLLDHIGWNKRILNEDDFDKCCASYGILFIETSMKWQGLYLVRQSIPVIAINSSLKGWQRLLVCWHEMVHHLLDTPELTFFSIGSLNKMEERADIISICSVIPKTIISCDSPYTLVEEYGFPEEIIQSRLKILYEFGI